MPRCRWFLLPALVAVAVACGDADDGADAPAETASPVETTVAPVEPGGGIGTDPLIDAVVDEVVTVARDEAGVDVDADCIRDGLPPEVASLDEIETALVEELTVACVDVGSLADNILSELPAEQAALLDRECLVAGLEERGAEVLEDRTMGTELFAGCVDPAAFIELLDAEVDGLLDDECAAEAIASVDLGQLFALGDAEAVGEALLPITLQCIEGGAAGTFIGQIPEGVEVDEACVTAVFADRGISLEGLAEDQSVLDADFYRSVYACFTPAEFAELVVERAVEDGADPAPIDQACIEELIPTVDLGPPAAEARGLPFAVFEPCGVVVPES